MELIMINGHITTMDSSNPNAEAVAVNSGKIAAVGSSDYILSLKTSDTKVIDLKGKMLLPGFNDSHMHLLNYGSSLMKADLIGAKSIEEVIEKTKRFAASQNLKPDEWIQGRGFNHDYFSIKRFPTRYDLDKISTLNPICLTRTCGHVSIVNSKALEIAGISKSTPQVEGGRFDIDENGEPLGIFRENALKLIYNIIPEPTVQDIKDMIITAGNKALSEGLTSVQSDDLESVPGDDFEKVITALKELLLEGKLPVRLNEQCLLPNMYKLKSFLNKGYMTGQGNSFLSIGPLKLLADGSLGARTAYLCDSYTDDPSTSGIPVYTQQELDELVLTAHNAGMQIAIHCIGSRAMYMALECIEKAQKQNPRNNARHSIVHCQITDETLLNKFKELDVIAHIQPIFLDYDLHIVEDRVGFEHARTSYNWKTMFDKGVHVACGSDCPVEYFNVLKGIYCAVTRKDMNGYPENGWLPEQKLSIDEALYGFTLGAAYASFEEDIKGSIATGKLADMVVLSQNLYEINPDNIKGVKVEMTFLEGKLVYEG